MESSVFMKKKKFAALRALNRKRNYIVKKIRYYSRLFVEKILWDKKKKTTIDLNSIKSILILRNDGKIGDVIVDSAIIKPLSQSGYSVDILVTPDNYSIIKNNDHIRNIYIANQTSLSDFLKKSTHNISKEIIDKLNSNKYDLIIDPSMFNMPMHRLRLLKEISAKDVISFNKKKWLNRYSESIGFDYKINHITKSYELLLSELNIIDNSVNYNLSYSDEIGSDVDNYLSSLPKNNINIILNIFAGCNERCLSLSQAKEIDEKINLLYNNVNVIILDYNKKIPKIEFPRTNIYNSASLQHSIALISKSDIVISPDTSIVHISAAFNVNLVAIYKNDPDNNVLWGPGYKNAIQLFASNSKLYDDENIVNDIVSAIANLMLKYKE